MKKALFHQTITVPKTVRMERHGRIASVVHTTINQNLKYVQRHLCQLGKVTQVGEGLFEAQYKNFVMQIYYYQNSLVALKKC